MSKRNDPESGLAKVYALSLLLASIAFQLGSFLYILDTAISATNIISITLFPALLYFILIKKFTKTGLLFVLAFFCFVFAAVFSAIFHPNIENYRLIRAAIVATSGAFWANWLTNRFPDIAQRAISIAFIVIFSVGLLQLSFIIIGIGIDPSSKLESARFTEMAVMTAGFPSIFTNPNDFSVYSTLVFLFFLFKKDMYSRVFQLLALAAVVMSGSKAAMIVCLIGVLISIQKLWTRVLIFVITVCLLVAYTNSDVEKTDIYAFDRLLTTVKETIRGEIEPDSSIALRTATHLFFLQEYPRFLLGSFNSSNPLPQFRSADFDTRLMAQNPHSMHIEFHGLFGFIGLIITLCLMIGLWRKLSENWHGIRHVYLFFSIVALTNIMSSTLHFHVFYTLASAIATQKNKKEFPKNLGQISSQHKV